MAPPARPPATHPQNPSLGPTSRPSPAPAPPPSPTTPAARRPGTPRRAAQDTPWATCVDGSRNSSRSQCKQDPRYRNNQIHHTSELKMARFSGGTYSKPDARVKMIPAEEITYLQHRKRYDRTVGSAGLPKRHSRRSVTPPPNSRKVSLVGSTSLTQVPSSSILHSQGQGSQKRSGSLPKGSMINPMSPSPKQMRGPHPSEDSICKKAGPSKSLCTQQGGKLCVRDINLTTINATAPGLQAPIVEPALPSSTSVLSGRPVEVYPDTRTAAPVAQEPSAMPDISLTTRNATAPGLQAPIVEPALLSPTSVLSGRPVEVYPDTRTAAPVAQEPTVMPVSLRPVPGHNESSTECNNIPPIHSPQSIASAQHGALLQERNPGASINSGRSSGASIILHSKRHKKHNQPEDHWKGIFHVTGELIHTLDGLEVHFPLQIDVKAYEASKHMPENLNLEALPLSQLWPKRFEMEPPDGQDIGLWFVSSHKRPHRSFSHLLEKISSHTGLWTKIGDTELAIFSSKLLSSHDQRKDGQLYFWGVFGKRLRKKRCQPNSHIKNVKISNPCQPKEYSCNKYEVCTKLDAKKSKETENTESGIGMTWGARGNPTDVTGNKERARDNYEGIAKVSELTGDKETDRVDGCMAVSGTPDSNVASSCSAPADSPLNRCCSHDSAKKSTLDAPPGSTKAHCQLQNEPAAVSCADAPPSLSLDTPPGFPMAMGIPPGFTKAHCQLQNEPAAVSCADAPPSLSLDTPPGFPMAMGIPPGFTKAHYQLQNEPAAVSCADAPPSLSLDTPPGFPMTMGIPPGFTKAHCQLQNVPAAVSCADALRSLILDTPPGFPMDMGIPPGFTEGHRRLPETCVSTPGTENNPPISFTLNVPRPVKMEVPPVFTALHAVKKEPGLPAVDKATKKQLPLVSAASSMGKAVKADEMEIRDNEIKVEGDENSEEREVPKIKRLSDLYPRPSDTDSSRFTQPAQPDKFQERAPEKQMHRRKRGRQESPEHSPAYTAIRRPNVNGRIAFNSNGGQGNGKARCACASSEGRAVLPTRAAGLSSLASSGERLDSESISLRCVVCGEEFPTQ